MGLRRRRRRLPGPRRVAVALLVLLLLVCLLGLGFWVVEVSLRPTFLVMARNQAEWTATRAIQEAVLDQIEASGLRYEDLVHLERDGEQRIVYLGANVLALNWLAASVTLAVQNRLAALEHQSFGVPLGQVLGSDLLARFGPRVEWELVPTGVVRVQIRDGFQAAGINQTRHFINLRVESVVRVIIPFTEDEVTAAAEVPLVDCVLLGGVPQTFVGLSLGELTFGGQK
ncbi:MAG: sporulation protein YunB [Moorellales bacterium]